MMMLSLSLAVSVCAIMVAVEGLPSSRYNPFITSNNNPQPHSDEQRIKDDDNEAMQNDGFNSKQIAFISTRMQPSYTTVSDDDRVQFPFSAIGELVNMDGGMCSGAFIHSNVFLTAAHCLYDHNEGDGNQVVPLRLILRRKGCDFDSVTVYHYLINGGTYIPDQWRINANLNYDYALVRTRNPSTEQLDIHPVDVENDLAGKNIPVKIVGYPGEGNPQNCMMRSDSCAVQGPDQDPNFPGRFYYNCDTSKGMSGGPVFAKVVDNFKIIGIDSQGFYPDKDPDSWRFNKAVAMTQAVVNEITNGIHALLNQPLNRV